MMRIYAVLDRKLREYGPLMIERNEEAMVRGLVNGIGSNRDHMMAKYPEDFDLYCLGTYDTETGEIAQADVRLVETLKGMLERFNGQRELFNSSNAEGV